MFNAILSSFCTIIQGICCSCVELGVLVLHAHDAHAVGALVLDEQGEGVVQFEEELEVT